MWKRERRIKIDLNFKKRRKKYENLRYDNVTYLMITKKKKGRRTVAIQRWWHWNIIFIWRIKEEEGESNRKL